MSKKLLPYINKFDGSVKVLPKSEGAKLNEDWARAKMATNEQGERVFRFKIATTVEGEDGKLHAGEATVDLLEIDNPEASDDGDRDSK